MNGKVFLTKSGQNQRMEKSMSDANVRGKTGSRSSGGGRPSGGVDRATQFMWLSRIFGGICFAVVTSATVLALSLIHLTSEAEANALLVSKPTYSENLAYFEPLHMDMPTMDVLAEMFVRQYVTVRNTTWKDLPEMRRMWGPGGIVRYMSTPAVYDQFWRREAIRYFDGERAPSVMIEPDIRRIIKEGWNSWQIFFDTRLMETPISEPVIDHWIATIQFRYYPGNAVMYNRLRNPLGFTVTQYHLARQRK